MKTNTHTHTHKEGKKEKERKERKSMLFSFLSDTSKRYHHTPHTLCYGENCRVDTL